MPKVAVPTDFHTTDAMRLQGDLEKLARSVRALSLSVESVTGPAGPPGPAGPAGPVGPTGPAGITGNANAISKFDTSTSPVALYQFDGNWNDSSGNGLTLTRNGNARFLDYAPSTRVTPFLGHFFDGSTWATRANNSLFALYNDLTIELLVYFNQAPGGTGAEGCWIEYGGNNTSSDGNPLYTFSHRQTATLVELLWYTESGASIGALYTASWRPPAGRISYVACTKTRSGSTCTIRYYVNGVLVATSGALANPDGGTINGFTVGTNDANNARLTNSALCSLRLSPVARSDADIKAEYNARLGGYYGAIP